MTKDEALKLALEHFETWSHEDSIFAGEFDKEITAIKEALAQPEHGWTPERIAGMARLKDAQDKKLAQPEQEPDYYGLTADHLWMSISKDHYDRLKPEYRMTCYTAPPQRKPLTDEQKVALCKQFPDHLTFNAIHAIEAAHGIKGEA